MAFDDEYISRKEAILAVTNDGCTANVVNVLYHLPSADVAPRAEVEYWKEQCFHACMNNGCLDKAIVKTAVAKEILEEIERLITKECLIFKDENGIRGYVDASVHYAIAELKKKYAEDKPNDN